MFPLTETTTERDGAATISSSPHILSKTEGSILQQKPELRSLWKTYLERTQVKQRNIAQTRQQQLWAPTGIQEQMWSTLLRTSRNVIGIAPTASGKTLSYAIPSLLLPCDSSKSTVIFVLVPTKELVQQVTAVYRRLIKIQQQSKKKTETTTAKATKTIIHRMVVPIHGGVHRESQLQAIQTAQSANNGLVLVATPGRLLDILEQHDKEDSSTRGSILHNHRRKWIILDEADQLTKEGDLGPQVHDIVTRLTSKQGLDTTIPTRMVMVSATMSEKAHIKFKEWMDLVGSDYVLIRVDDDTKSTPPTESLIHGKDVEDSKQTIPEPDMTSTTTAHNKCLLSRIPSHLEQIVHVCSEHKKPRKLVHTLQTIQNRCQEDDCTKIKKGIVFYSKIEKLEYSCKLLRKEGIQCLPLHGQLPTALRQQHLHQFVSAGHRSNGEKRLALLLATDVAARGVDVPDVDFVIQYDFAGNLEQYVHRCGRAGRSSTTRALEQGSEQPTRPSKPKKQFVVYSFFTRNMQRMASDLVKLLEASQAWVDPNLRALIGTTDTDTKTDGSKSKRSSKRKSDQAPNKQQQCKIKRNKQSSDASTKRAMGDADTSSDDNDEFANLSANRIVLKRASHVSDVSEDDDDGDDRSE
ncbi:DNA/RNA helicase, superfamily II, SNF2 family protein [Nitzschia inconspicua]|uniref:ATP-dependent RNA helicase n=1 Tax=Nitzschia inconspicua TaxID=303405 RepID=A0A9K3KCU9_9STRA|nr:DNA/RNA helicase, superfamily II, SNF2 family protein [Nitzschia inconspicua]